MASNLRFCEWVPYLHRNKAVAFLFGRYRTLLSKNQPHPQSCDEVVQSFCRLTNEKTANNCTLSALALDGAAVAVVFIEKNKQWQTLWMVSDLRVCIWVPSLHRSRAVATLFIRYPDCQQCKDNSPAYSRLWTNQRSAVYQKLESKKGTVRFVSRFPYDRNYYIIPIRPRTVGWYIGFIYSFMYLLLIICF